MNLLAAELWRQEAPLSQSRSRSLCGSDAVEMGKSRTKHHTQTKIVTETAGKYIYSMKKNIIVPNHTISPRREAPGDRQHAGAGPDPERQLGLLQPPGADPHRAPGQETQQDRDPEARHLLHPPPRRPASRRWEAKQTSNLLQLFNFYSTKYIQYTIYIFQQLLLFRQMIPCSGALVIF